MAIPDDPKMRLSVYGEATESEPLGLLPYNLKLDQGLYLLGDGTEFSDEGLFCWASAGQVLDKEKRRQLKELGWKCKRHTRTKEEMWSFSYFSKK